MDHLAPRPSGRRPVAMAVLACLALGTGAGLAVGLAGNGPDGPYAGRALSAAEARRMAAMRVTNYRDGRAGVHATLGSPETPTLVTGWVDWSRALIYLTVDESGNGGQHRLVQAIPGLLATRPTEAPTSGTAPPPVPPTDGWRIRRLDVGGSRPNPVDTLVTLLFGIAADRPDPSDELARGSARWLGRGQAAGTAVDVLLGPVAAASATAGGRPGPSPTSLAELGGTMRYWLDRDARLHRLAAVLPGGLPLAIDLDRSARPELIAIGGLGGRPIRPRAVTNAEADQLAGLRSSNRARQGARVTLAVPTEPAVNLRGGGWLDWRAGVAYLAVDDLDAPERSLLLRADHIGIADHPAPRRSPRTFGRRASTEPATGSPGRHPSAGSRTGSPGRHPSAGSPTASAAGGADLGQAAPPPLPPPTDRAWTFTSWQGRADALGGRDLDLLINEALSCGGRTVDDAVELRASAVWLRGDTLDGRSVSVFEMPKPAEAGEPPGRARLRYWVDGAGLLRRLELRTRTGAFGQLDLDPGPVPRLAPVALN